MLVRLKIVASGVNEGNSLVVVNDLAGSLVVTSLLGRLEITDIPDEGRSMTVGSGTATVVLIVLVVEDEELLVLGVEDPALVGVGGTLVAGDGDELWVLLVGNVVDGEGVLVVAVADLTALDIQSQRMFHGRVVGEREL